MGLRQRADERGSWSLVRGQGRERSVGSGRGHQLNARQVFDESLSTRARLREAERKSTREVACSGMIKGSRGMLLARWLGQRD
jgi:hypothetical protein